MSTATAAHRVLLVREWDQQATGGSCCGRLEGGDTAFAGAADFGRCRHGMEQMGAVYRALVAELSGEGIDGEVVSHGRIPDPGVAVDLVCRSSASSRR